MPVDRTSDNPLWKSKDLYYDDFYAIWDTFRTFATLLNIIAPRRQSDIIYIESSTLNGKNFDRAYLMHNELLKGGELVYKMTATPSLWASKNLPISKMKKLLKEVSK